MKNKDTQFLHASARAAYLESRLTTKDELLKAAEAEGADDAFRLLSAKGMFSEYGIGEYEKAFERELNDAYELIEDITENIGLTKIFRYPVDGHNLKVLIKSKALGKEEVNLYKSGGTIDIVKLREEYEAAKTEELPLALLEAGKEAEQKLAKTKDSQQVDLIIDRAVIALMKDKAEQIDNDTLTEYMELKIDIINIRTALRLLRMKKDTRAASKAFTEGGSISVKELTDAYALGYDGIKKALDRMNRGAKLTESIDEVKESGKIGAFESKSDMSFRELIDESRTKAFGIEPVISYLYKKEQEIKACRIVLVSKLYGLSKGNIAERIGYIYAD